MTDWHEKCFLELWINLGDKFSRLGDYRLGYSIKFKTLS